MKTSTTFLKTRRPRHHQPRGGAHFGGKSQDSPLCASSRLLTIHEFFISPATTLAQRERTHAETQHRGETTTTTGGTQVIFSQKKKCYWRAQISKSSRNASQKHVIVARRRENDRGNIPSGKDTQIFGINFSVPTTKIFGSEKVGEISISTWTKKGNSINFFKEKLKLN